jgi:hypothetical protein
MLCGIVTESHHLINVKLIRFIMYESDPGPLSSY